MHYVLLDFCTHTKNYCYCTFELHFLPSNLHSDLHDICFVNVFDSFIPVLVLKTFRFKSMFSGKHTVVDKSLKLLQLSTHLSKLTTCGY